MVEKVSTSTLLLNDGRSQVRMANEPSTTMYAVNHMTSGQIVEVLA